MSAILSAILFRLSFDYDVLGPLMIGSITLWVISEHSVLHAKNTPLSILIWSVIALPGHFWGIYLAIKEHATDSGVIALGVYAGVIIWFALFGITLVVLIGRFLGINSIFSRAVIVALFFYGITRHALLGLFMVVGGYPLLDPQLPLMRYATEVEELKPKEWRKIKNRKGMSIYVTPLVPMPKRGGSASTALEVYRSLSLIENRVDTATPHIIIATEAVFSYALNEHMDWVAVWQTLLEANQTLIIGALKRDDGGMRQSLYFIQKDRIIDIYDKKFCVDGYECIQEDTLMGNVFSLFMKDDLGKLVPATNAGKSVLIDIMNIRPIVCSELFHPELIQQDDDLITFTVRDEWFDNQTRRWIEWYARWVVMFYRKPALFITPVKCLYITPFF